MFTRLKTEGKHFGACRSRGEHLFITISMGFFLIGKYQNNAPERSLSLHGQFYKTYFTIIYRSVDSCRMTWYKIVPVPVC